MGIKEVRPAGSAEIYRRDTVRCKPCGQELILGNGNQVKMNGSRAGGAVAWRLHAEGGERTPSGARRCGFRYLAKEPISMQEAPLKRLPHLFSHIITTHANGRPQHGKQVLRVRTIRAAHLPHSFLDDACQQATPPGVNCRHSSMSRVYQQYGKAIGGSHRQQDTGLLG
jgi:hypothetical protein